MEDEYIYREANIVPVSKLVLALEYYIHPRHLSIHSRLTCRTSKSPSKYIPGITAILITARARYPTNLPFHSTLHDLPRTSRFARTLVPGHTASDSSTIINHTIRSLSKEDTRARTIVTAAEILCADLGVLSPFRVDHNIRVYQAPLEGNAGTRAGKSQTS